MSTPSLVLLADPGVGLSGDDMARWRFAIQRERFRWRQPTPCTVCGEWVGHFGGSAERDPCACIPEDVPLEEVRVNCFTVRRYWIGDAIREACKS